ncbi:hypothetical protein D3C84_288540 [compost metagenome]
MAQPADAAQRFIHQGTVDVAVVFRGGHRPGGENRRLRLERTVPHQQPKQVALLQPHGPGPDDVGTVIGEQHPVAGLQLAGSAPLGLQAPAGERGDLAHWVIRGQTQLMPLASTQSQHGPNASQEEAPGGGRVVDAVDSCHEWPAQQFMYLARPLCGMHPGIGGDARVGRPDRLAPPVVVQLVDPVDEDEAGLGEVVGGDHDHVPQVPGLDAAVDLAGHQAVLARYVAVVHRPVAPDHLGRVMEVQLVPFLGVHRVEQRPFGVVLHRVHEGIADQQAEVELAQAAVLALGADELAHIRVADVEGAHLGATAAAGGAHGEAHLVVDIHERQRPAGLGTGAGNVGAVRAQGAEFVTDAATGLEGEPGFMDLAEDVVHGVEDGAGDRAVDGRGGRLEVLGAGVGDDPPGRHRAVAQGPEEAFVPVFAGRGVGLHFGQGAGNALPGGVRGDVDRRAVLVLEAVLAVPDVLRRRLQGDAVVALDLLGCPRPGHPLPSFNEESRLV